MNRFSVKAIGLATAVVTLSGLALAQDQSANQSLNLMTGNSQLVRPLNTKSAAPGQAVTIKLTDSIKTPEGVEIPRGSELMGKVDEVKASDNHGPATLVLTFNQARLKDGKTLPVKTTIAGFAAASEGTQLPSLIASDSTFDQEAESHSGVALHSAVQDKTSGTLTDQRSNISLNAGTQFLVAVSVQPTQTAGAAE
jgi:hypothetical protein